MGEYEPNDSRNVTGTASTQDGRWTGQSANDPTRQDQMQAQQGGQANQQGFAEGFSAQEAAQASQGQMQQSGQSVGQQDDGVSGAGNQGNDHTSAIGRNQGPSGSQAGSAQSGGQPQQFQDTLGQHGAGGSGAGSITDQIAKHQEVVDADGEHVGTVDHVDGDRIKLTRKDSADGEHHYISLTQVAGIEGGRIRLSGSGDRAR